INDTLATPRSGLPPPNFVRAPRRRNTIQDLRIVVVVTQVSFSLVLATILALLPSALLLLNRELSISTAQYLFGLTIVSGAVAGARSYMDMRRLDFLLRALSEDSDIVDARDVSALGKQAGRACVQWLLAHVVLLAVFATPMRPALMDFTTGVALMWLSGTIAATVTLPLYAALRNTLLQVIELVPAKVMTEVVTSQENSRESRERISRRLLFAVLAPMLVVAIACALIANAHVRRADERSYEEIARVMARAVFEPRPTTLDAVGLQDLYSRATELGFPTQVIESEHSYKLRPLEGGFLEITTPLDSPVAASAIVRFHGSSVGVMSTESGLFAVLAIVVAAALGLALGNALTQDLYNATQGVRLLGTRALLSKPSHESRLPRFRIVRQLQSAVEGVANRFGIFAQAQQDAIAARAAATRMRGQFFASVSHDLKGPLNSILGFTELVRMEQLSDGQAESLQVIADRGQELLSLIETILDAARIEVGQLSLMFDEEPFNELYAATLDKAIALSGRSDMQIYEEIEPDLPAMLVDRIRGARAIATFIAYSVRATDAGKMWVRAERHGPHHVRIDVDVPALLHTAADLQQMLDPAGGLAKREHRGLALALQLANSVVKLHGGSVHVIDRRQKGAMFCITLPTASGVANAVRAPEPDHVVSITPQRLVNYRPHESDDERGPDTERPPPPPELQAANDDQGPDTERPLPYDPDQRDTEPPTAPEGYPVPDTERPPPPDPVADGPAQRSDQEPPPDSAADPTRSSS
ncbi:MAG TPA: histidine kinase dimerization/phospho-acceptor domain-containing protein, partial [Polyangiaceae bacterium]|nr:histidine kinase dimerization/phospho-acceptor domain-containing protein [Polyangiaceae bacterium]